MASQEQLRADVLNQQVALIEQQQGNYLNEWKREMDALQDDLRQAQRQLQTVVRIPSSSSHVLL